MTDLLWVQRRLSGEGLPLLIDGGMGTELEKSGVPMDGKVWSARAMLSNPDKVRDVHERYIRAGAEAIITNTFSSARHMLEPGDLGAEVRNLPQGSGARAPSPRYCRHLIGCAGRLYL